MLFEQTRAMTSTLECSTALIFRCCTGQESSKMMKGGRLVGASGLYSRVSDALLPLFTILRPSITISVHMSACFSSILWHSKLLSVLQIQCKRILINSTQAENNSEKTAVSFEISIRAPMHERAILALLFFCAWQVYVNVSACWMQMTCQLCGLMRGDDEYN